MDGARTYLAPVGVVVGDLLDRPGEHRGLQIHLSMSAPRGPAAALASRPSRPHAGTRGSRPGRPRSLAHARAPEQAGGICEERGDGGWFVALPCGGEEEAAAAGEEAGVVGETRVRYC